VKPPINNVEAADQQRRLPSNSDWPLEEQRKATVRQPTAV
jgi:hypothetical protein